MGRPGPKLLSGALLLKTREKNSKKSVFSDVFSKTKRGGFRAVISGSDRKHLQCRDLTRAAQSAK
eukprot:6284003-Amphidinium_carterae.1